MSAVYTGKGGKEYKYHDLFNDVNKDLGIISSDNIALRVDSNVLKVYSSVFSSMFSTCNKDNNFVHLDHSSQALVLYLTAINDRPLDLKEVSWEHLKEAVELCVRYNTLSTGPKMLFQLQPIDRFERDKAYEIFLMASKFNDVLTACRVIATLAWWRDEREPVQDLLWRRNNWPREVMEPLPSAWVWAYTRSHMDFDVSETSPQYWNNISASFMKYLLP